MKKIILALSSCLVLTVFMSRISFAVWSPSTTMEEEGTTSPPEPESAEKRLSQPVKERLQEDELRLETAVRDLKADVQELNRSTEKSKTELDRNASSEGDQDGHPLR